MDNFQKQLISYFPNEEKAIKRYCKKLDQVWDNSPLLNLQDIKPNRSESYEDYETNAYDYINSLTDNKELQGVLAATNSLYIGVKEKTPLYIHANINNFYIKSAWRIGEDGANMAKLLSNIIEDQGGLVLSKHKVVGLIVDDSKQVVAAETKNGSQFFGRKFISNIHPTETFNLLEPGLLRKSYTNRINKLQNTMSMFMLMIPLNKGKIKHINSNVYYIIDNKVWEHYEYTEEDWPKGYMMYTTEDSDNKGFAESVVLITMMHFADVRKWENTTVGKRGEEYLKFKEDKAKKMLDLLYVKFPEIETEIDTVYSASPLTFRDYTSTFEGTPYGIIKDCNNLLGTLLSPKTRIKNLFFTGQNIGFHGLLGVIMSAFHTVSNITDMNKILKEMRDFK